MWIDEIFPSQVNGSRGLVKCVRIKKIGLESGQHIIIIAVYHIIIEITFRIIIVKAIQREFPKTRIRLCRACTFEIAEILVNEIRIIKGERPISLFGEAIIPDHGTIKFDAHVV
jgi:hypothetical protein